MTDGRALDPGIYPGRKLGPLLQELRPHPYELPVKLVLTMAEVKRVVLFTRSFEIPAHDCQGASQDDLEPGIACAKLLCMGQALIAPLRLSLLDRGVPVWLNTHVKQLIVEDECVVGVSRRERGASRSEIRANRGVVLAAGGFAHNQEMREKIPALARQYRVDIGQPWQYRRCNPHGPRDRCGDRADGGSLVGSVQRSPPADHRFSTCTRAVVLRDPS